MNIIESIVCGDFTSFQVTVNDKPVQVIWSIWSSQYKLDLSALGKKKFKHEIKIIIDGHEYCGLHALKLVNYSALDEHLSKKYFECALTYEERDMLPQMLGTVMWYDMFMKDSQVYAKYKEAIVLSIKGLHDIVLALHGMKSPDDIFIMLGSLDVFIPEDIRTGSSVRMVNRVKQEYLNVNGGTFIAKKYEGDHKRSGSMNPDYAITYLIKELIKYKYPDFMMIKNYGIECASIVTQLYPKSNDKIDGKTLHEIFMNGFEALW